MTRLKPGTIVRLGGDASAAYEAMIPIDGYLWMVIAHKPGGIVWCKSLVSGYEMPFMRNYLVTKTKEQTDVENR